MWYIQFCIHFFPLALYNEHFPVLVNIPSGYIVIQKYILSIHLVGQI